MDLGIVMIVDDEEMMRETVAEMLRDRAEKIIPAQSGAAAMRKLVEIDKINVVITDLKMPDVDGFELLDRMKLIDPNIPVVVMSGYSESFSVEEAMKRGAAEYILKPFKKEEINMIVDRALWRAASRGKNILLRYILAANQALAQSNIPDKAELMGIGEKLRQSVDQKAQTAVQQVSNETQ